jgi:hypothetical protein
VALSAKIVPWDRDFRHSANKRSLLSNSTLANIAKPTPNIGGTAGVIPASDGEVIMEQLALTVAEACAAGRVGKTVLYQAIASGALVARKLGQRLPATEATGDPGR